MKSHNTNCCQEGSDTLFSIFYREQKSYRELDRDWSVGRSGCGPSSSGVSFVTQERFCTVSVCSMLTGGPEDLL